MHNPKSWGGGGGGGGEGGRFVYDASKGQVMYCEVICYFFCCA